VELRIKKIMGFKVKTNTFILIIRLVNQLNGL